ncbi:hypothetical protein OCU04_006412 [Sclerotinia nivalis]|uniref:Secreted protein n=1 Tax=Sclerotinia nivalis TaxID=352851 RepID=A0A9X0AMZ6_9HELO|nr:hypothetical protein OCU04_006412 [Sclerotinia nivalis]
MYMRFSFSWLSSFMLCCLRELRLLPSLCSRLCISALLSIHSKLPLPSSKLHPSLLSPSQKGIKKSLPHIIYKEYPSHSSMKRPDQNPQLIFTIPSFLPPMPFPSIYMRAVKYTSSNTSLACSLIFVVRLSPYIHSYIQKYPTDIISPQTHLQRKELRSNAKTRKMKKQKWYL